MLTKSLILLALILGLVGGFFIGMNAESYSRRSIEVENACAHYDSRTGEFTWGAAPLAIGMLPNPLDPHPVSDLPLNPKHKPPVPKGNRTDSIFVPVD